MVVTLRRFAALLIALAINLPSAANAGSPEPLDTARYTLYFPNSETSSPSSMEDLAQRTRATVDTAYDELSRALQFSPRHKVVLRFLTPEEFHRRTGAPSWTSAMFLRGEISIPLPNKEKINFSEIERAVRHEYVHAVLAELSGRQIPAWLDEGLAQVFEGDVNPLLGPSLRRWVKRNEAMPLDWLREGFMSLNDDIVPAAYAQSLFATRKLLAESGWRSVKSYLIALKRGDSAPEAFRTAFARSESAFEDELTVEMRVWSDSGIVDP